MMAKLKFKGTKGPYEVGVVRPIPTARKGQHIVNVRSEKSDLILAKVVGKDYTQCFYNALLVAEAPAMFDLLTEIVDGLEDKGKLSVWELSLKTTAQQILDRITNQKPQ